VRRQAHEHGRVDVWIAGRRSAVQLGMPMFTPSQQRCPAPVIATREVDPSRVYVDRLNQKLAER
jgi:hypothetical protein